MPTPFPVVDRMLQALHISSVSLHTAATDKAEQAGPRTGLLKRPQAQAQPQPQAKPQEQGHSPSRQLHGRPMSNTPQLLTRQGYCQGPQAKSQAKPQATHPAGSSTGVSHVCPSCQLRRRALSTFQAPSAAQLPTSTSCCPNSVRTRMLKRTGVPVARMRLTCGYQIVDVNSSAGRGEVEWL
jgi:hypothetical protein